MAILLVKKPEIKLTPFLNYASSKANWEDSSMFSVLVVSNHKPYYSSFAFGLQSVSQIPRTVATMHKRESYVVIFASAELKCETFNKYFPPFVLTTNYSSREIDSISPIILPFTEGLKDMDLDGEHSMLSLKIAKLRSLFNIDTLSKAVNTLDPAFCKELSSYLGDGPIIYFSKNYGLKVMENGSFDLNEYEDGIFEAEIFESNIKYDITRNDHTVPLKLIRTMTTDAKKIELPIATDYDADYEHSLVDSYSEYGDEPMDSDEHIKGEGLEKETVEDKEVEKKKTINSAFPTMATDDILECRFIYTIGDLSDDECTFSDYYKVFSISNDSISVADGFGIGNFSKRIDAAELIKDYSLFKVSYG